MYVSHIPVYVTPPPFVKTSRDNLRSCVIIFIYIHTIYIYIYGGARGVMVIVAGNGHGDTIQILTETDCISYNTNTFGKCMDPVILPPAMGKY